MRTAIKSTTKRPRSQILPMDAALKGYQPGTYVFTLYYGNKIQESKRLIIQ